ncbi:MinD/ParA family protein [Solidesulfovibrio sp.]|jgi:flagellar biosynthesis protein FlhG|uniref:MinD/ParA family protein n=1 Tax=Solidesulfovibrio sp. TaxID=2910990 RepID=UPI002B1E9816|nr:MinD/ParA family protein [Solidesulfovibrio sp.]MEA5090546.1 MinD/ParA family protein [Solidesulfovibrio sp.]HML59890.1 MinD/ParA family protein [Solidesulfovibrio sp.]
MSQAINPNTSMSVAILSGKGGVGKSNLALNLSYALFRAGHRALLMDFDVGLANVDVLLGLSPEKNLQDLFRPEVTAAEVMVPVEQGGFDFLPAASGVPELLEMDDDMREILFQKLNASFSAYDYLMLDLGAGISQTVLTVAVMSHVRVLVVTPEPTSLTDSYAVIKVLHTQYGITDFHILVNQVESAADTKTTYSRLSAACQHFLGFAPELLGGVRSDPALPDAVRRQIPLMRHAPRSPAAQDILSAAVKLHRIRQSRQEALRDMPVLGKIPQPRK